jgi:hypothetical protein
VNIGYRESPRNLVRGAFYLPAVVEHI